MIERLRFIRSFGLDPLLARQVHANRLRRLAHEGEQYTPQFLVRFDPLRRYATLVAYLLDMAATLTDTALEMHDHIMGLLFKQGQKKQLAQFELRGKAINEKVRLYADVGHALIKAKEEVADPYKALEAVLPWETFVASVQEASTLARPADFDYLDLLDDHYSHIRKYCTRAPRHLYLPRRCFQSATGRGPDAGTRPGTQEGAGERTNRVCQTTLGVARTHR